MSSKDRKTQLKTPLAQALTSYLATNHITQVDLAELLNVDERTLRRWKNGEVVLTDIRELKRIADILGIYPENLGVVSEAVPFSSEQIDLSIDHVWKLVNGGKSYEANILVDKLLVNITGLIQTEDIFLLTKLALVQHIAGYVKSQTTRTYQADLPLKHYQEMERLARIVGDNELLIIALSYEGDMLQRGGHVLEAISYLEQAKDIPSSTGARGNTMQLLGRAYFKAQRLADFERAIKESEMLAFEPASSVKGQFNAGTVYEEYGRSLGLLGQLNQGMDYIEKAEKIFGEEGNMQKRRGLIASAKAIALVHGGEISQGIDAAIETIDICKQTGNIRQMDRIYAIQRYLDKLSRDIGHAGSVLREALDGPVEY